MKGIKILGTGIYAPEKVVTNDDFTEIVETSDEWIYTRTGMKRRHLSQGEPTWFMATEACKNAIESAGISSEEIDMIISSSVTPDFFTPSASCILQRELGIKECITFDINAACSGFVYGLDMARRYLATGDVRNILVVGAENLTKITDYTDRGSCVLFGDGAGACVVCASDTLFASHLGAQGSGAKYMIARNLSPANAFMPELPINYEDGLPQSEGHYLFMDGKEVYKFAIKALPKAVNKALEKTDLSIDDIDLIIPHQANIRIIETAAQRLGVSMDKMFVNIEEYGNTSSASVPLALDEAMKTKKIKKGDKVCLVGFGAGLTYGAVIFEV